MTILRVQKLEKKSNLVPIGEALIFFSLLSRFLSTYICSIRSKLFHSANLETIKILNEKMSFAEKKKKTIFERFTNKFINQPRCSTRDQSVQTSLYTSIKNSTLKQHTYSTDNSNVNDEISTRRRRSSLKTFLTLNSPKTIPRIHRTRRRSVNLTTPKRLSSECLVSLLRSEASEC